MFRLTARLLRRKLRQEVCISWFGAPIWVLLVASLARRVEDVLHAWSRVGSTDQADLTLAHTEAHRLMQPFLPRIWNLNQYSSTDEGMRRAGSSQMAYNHDAKAQCATSHLLLQ